MFGRRRSSCELGSCLIPAFAVLWNGGEAFAMPVLLGARCFGGQLSQLQESEVMRMEEAGRDDGLKMGQIVARCWSDPEFKLRFVEDPKSVFREYEIPVPESLDIEVLENNETKRYFLLPASPLDGGAGAGDVSQVYGANTWCAPS
jgi:hypothetical protein